MNMLGLSDENEYLLNKILIGTGVTSGGFGSILTAFSAYLGVLLQITGLISFLCFLIINNEKIEEQLKKIYKRIFTKDV